MHLKLSTLGFIALAISACGGRVPFNDGLSDAGDGGDGGGGGGGGDDQGGGDSGGSVHDSALPPPPQRCPATCSTPAGTASVYTSIDAVNTALQGSWTLCSGHLKGPIDTVGIELDMIGKKAYYLVNDGTGKAVRGQGFAYQLTIDVIDASGPNGPGSYQLNIYGNGVGGTYFSSYSECPRKLQLNDVEGSDAELAADAPLQPVACSLNGRWDITQSDNGTKGGFEFDLDGAFIGADSAAAIPSAPTFGGQYEMSKSNVLSLDDSYGMACDTPAAYQATFDKTCNSVALHLLTDSCASRSYLHTDQTLSRK